MKPKNSVTQKIENGKKERDWQHNNTYTNQMPDRRQIHFHLRRSKKIVRFRKSSKTTLYTVQQFHSAGNRHNIKRNYTSQEKGEGWSTTSTNQKSRFEMSEQRSNMA